MISVCLASYEDDHFLNDQITSILVQLSEFDELIKYLNNKEKEDKGQRLIEINNWLTSLS